MEVLATASSSPRLICSCRSSGYSFSRSLDRPRFSRRTARDLYKHSHQGPGHGREHADHDVTFSELLQQAEHCTFHPPHGQTMGRAGRRSILEDGERMLYRCIVMRPESIAPRLMLMSNLLFQARGREEEVPALVLSLLRHTSLGQTLPHHSETKQVLAAVKMGLDALAMSEKKYRVPDFVQHVAAAVPELKTAVLELLDYSERRAERRRATFMGTDSFEDVM